MITKENTINKRVHTIRRYCAELKRTVDTTECDACGLACKNAGGRDLKQNTGSLYKNIIVK